ncbi:MAG: T9SS type A sorting domain-containing protein, partial [Bacteroidota bacterium]
MTSITKHALALCCFLGIFLSTQAQNCLNIVPQLDCTGGPFTICENDFVAVPSLATTSTLPTLEYVVTKTGELAADGLGNRILGSSTSAVFDPTVAPFNLLPGESFEVYPVAYDLASVQALTEDLLNGTFPFFTLTLPCCQAIELVVPSFCTNLNSAGYFNGTDIQSLNDVFALVDLFAAVPGSTFSVPGFLASIDNINASAGGGVLPPTCGAANIPICYAAPVSGSGICSYYILSGTDAACLPLPLTLIEFNGEALAWSNLLTWTTENNTAFSSFSVERSRDGIQFFLLEDFSLTPDEEANLFSFEDKSPLLRENYYRLSIVGEEGETDYSGTIIVKRTDKAEFRIDALAPNPARDLLTIGIINDAPGVIQLQLIDMNGQIVEGDRFALPVGVSAQTIDVADLPSGVYFISLRKGNQTTTEKF